jgi:hypothetical protein
MKLLKRGSGFVAISANGLQIGGRFNAANVLLCAGRVMKTNINN